MSDANPGQFDPDGAASGDGGGFAPTHPNAGEEFEAVDVFPEPEEFDLRSGADSCYKCSTCDTNCPVAEVDDDFPGPKFQGPEQWRLKQAEDDYGIDESVMDCSNCMRCDDACPAGVPLSQMHNTARAEYVSEQMRVLSREYVRNRILANYRLFAAVGSRVPRLTNAVLNNSLVQWANEKLLGVTAERDFPAFATETFREWWTARGGAATPSTPTKGLPTSTAVTRTTTPRRSDGRWSGSSNTSGTNSWCPTRSVRGRPCSQTGCWPTPAGTPRSTSPRCRTS